MSKRLTKEELHDDEFVSALYAIIRYVENNYPKVLAGIGVVVVISLIGYFIQESANRRIAAANDAIGTVQVALMQGNTSTAITNAQSVIRDYEGEPVAGQALTTLANIYFDQGRFDEATTHYRQFLSTNDANFGPEEFGAWSGIASSMEAQGNLSGAAQQYLSYADRFSNTAYAPLALFQAARTYKLAGSTDSAVNAYQRIVSQYSDSPAAISAKTELGILGVVVD
jgi:predicted negative regulator of RcsB-dependent stress response